MSTKFSDVSPCPCDKVLVLFLVLGSQVLVNITDKIYCALAVRCANYSEFNAHSSLV